METILYLVRLRHSMDDLPLFIDADKDAAIAFANDAPWQPKPELCNLLVSPDISTPIRIDVIEFRGGVPKAIVFVREFEE